MHGVWGKCDACDAFLAFSKSAHARARACTRVRAIGTFVKTRKTRHMCHTACERHIPEELESVRCYSRVRASREDM